MLSRKYFNKTCSSLKSDTSVYIHFFNFKNGFKVQLNGSQIHGNGLFWGFTLKKNFRGGGGMPPDPPSFQGFSHFLGGSPAHPRQGHPVLSMKGCYSLHAVTFVCTVVCRDKANGNHRVVDLYKDPCL